MIYGDFGNWVVGLIKPAFIAFCGNFLPPNYGETGALIPVFLDWIGLRELKSESLPVIDGVPECLDCEL